MVSSYNCIVSQPRNPFRLYRVVNIWLINLLPLMMESGEIIYVTVVSGADCK